MNRKIILLLLLFFVGKSMVFACGPEAINREFSLFLKTYNRSHPLYYFYFNSGSFDFGDYNNELAKQPSANELEWVRLLDNKFESAVIQSYIGAPQQFYRNKRPTVDVNDEAKLAEYLSANKPFVAEYVEQLYAYSSYNQQYGDMWNYNGYVYRQDSSVLFKLIENTKQIYKKTKDVNLKWRCAYHILRMAYFNKYTFTADKLYAEFVTPLPKNKSVMEFWCWGIKGGILKSQGKKEEAFLQYARRFMRDTSDANTVYVDLKHLQKLDMEKLLRLCKNDDDKLAVILAKSVNTADFNLQSLEYANQNLKDEAMLKFVYQRELQKLEANYIRQKLMAETDENNRRYFSENLRLPQENEFVALLDFTRKKAANPKADAYWNNARAYLSIVKKDFSSAKEQLELAQNNSQKTSIDIAQTKMLIFLSESIRNEKIDPQKLANFTLDFYQDEKIANDDRNSFAIFSYNFILPKLLKEGNVTEALAIAAMRDEGIDNHFFWYESDENEPYDNLKKDSVDIFKNSQFANYYFNYSMNESEFEKTVKEIVNGQSEFMKTLKKKFTFTYNQSDYAKLLLYKKVRQEDWDGALALINQTDYLNQEKFIKPLEMHYDDNRNPHGRDSLSGILDAKGMLTLGKQLKNELNKSKPETHFRYGQFLYHLTYYGYNRALMDDNTHESRHFSTPVYYAQNKIETQEWYYWFHNIYKVQVQPEALSYYDCSTAMTQFEQALRIANSDEDKAKINFMLARCYQKNAPLPEFKNDEKYNYMREQAVKYKGKTYDTYSYHSFTNPYFKELKTNYANTETYQRAFGECSYLEMYLD